MNFNLQGLRRTIAQFISPGENVNRFNEAFLWGVGGGYTAYDTDGLTYLNEGYKINPIVYSVISQQATKTSAIPYSINKIESNQQLQKLRMLEKATNFEMTPQQRVKHFQLKTEALSKSELPMPLDVPNPTQTWTEFMELYKTFIKLTGNVYLYSLAPDAGSDAGEPMAIYILPSHLMQIVVKGQTEYLGIESPIEGYQLVWGRNYIEFDAEDVIHIKYPNPEYGENGEHLYGVSPLRAALKNIQSSNTALDLNIKTLKSGGAFGFIHGKGTVITPEQAAEIKNRLVEMNNSPDDLSKIAGVSAEMGFTRLSLTSDELRPFDYLNFDQKQICNVLGWSDKLLNSDTGAKYDNVSQFRKQVITDNIVPDLKLISEALNKYWFPRFKAYKNYIITFDVMELPEMQVDIAGLSGWLNNALDRGIINRNEYRLAINYAEQEDEVMERFTVASDIISLTEAMDNDFNVPDEGQKLLNSENQKAWDAMLVEAKINSKN